MGLSQNEATRFVSVIDNRIGRRLGRGTVLEITYGDVSTVSGRTASVLIGGDDNESQGFRIPSGLRIEPGDRVRVAIDPRGFRYVEEVLAPTNHSKMVLDAVRGQLLIGDGSAEPADGLVLSGTTLDLQGLTFRNTGSIESAEDATDAGEVLAFGATDVWLTLPDCEVSFTPDYVGQKFLCLGMLTADSNSGAPTAVHGGIRIDADSGGTTEVDWIAVQYSDHSSASGMTHQWSLMGIWTADAVAQRFLHAAFRVVGGTTTLTFLGGSSDASKVILIPLAN